MRRCCARRFPIRLSWAKSIGRTARSRSSRLPSTRWSTRPRESSRKSGSRKLAPTTSRRSGTNSAASRSKSSASAPTARSFETLGRPETIYSGGRRSSPPRTRILMDGPHVAIGASEGSVRRSPRERLSIARGPSVLRTRALACKRAVTSWEEDMAIFDTLIDDVASQVGLGSNAGLIVREILSTITGTPGGVGGFLNNLKTAGLSTEVASWLGHANAAPLAAAQVDRAFGSTAISGIASRLGLAPTLVSSAVGYALPKVISLLTPGGVIP